MSPAWIAAVLVTARQLAHDFGRRRQKALQHLTRTLGYLRRPNTSAAGDPLFRRSLELNETESNAIGFDQKDLENAFSLGSCSHRTFEQASAAWPNSLVVAPRASLSLINSVDKSLR